MVIATEGSAQYTELNLINWMTIFLQRIQATVDLTNSIKVYGRSTHKHILVTQIGTRHTWLIGAKVAVVLTAELIGRQGYTDVQDATITTHSILD